MTQADSTVGAGEERAHWFAVFLAKCVLASPRVSPIPVLNLRRAGWEREHGAVVFSARGHGGVKICAAYIAAGEKKKKQPVLLLHGWGQTKTNLLHQAGLLRKHGHDCLLVDLRGHGRSGGRGTTFGWYEKHDVSAVIDEAQKRGWVTEKVSTMGLSLGAATVLQHAAVDPRVNAVVALAPYVDMAEAVRSFKPLVGPWFADKWVLRGFAEAARRAGFAMGDASPLEAVRKIHVPVLLAVGSRDQQLGLKTHTTLLASAKKSGVCEVLEVRGPNHFNLHRGIWPKLDEAIVRFLDGV